LDYVPGGESWDVIEDRLRHANFRGAIVGPHGHGKTTLMLALRDRLQADAAFDVRYLQVMAEGSNAQRVCASIRERDTLLLLDGYDLLGWADRLRLWRRPRTVVTRHGRTLLPQWVRCETSEPLLGQLIKRLSVETYAALGDSGVAALYDRHHGNVRDALRELYDSAARGDGVPG